MIIPGIGKVTCDLHKPLDKDFLFVSHGPGKIVVQVYGRYFRDKADKPDDENDLVQIARVVRSER